MITTIDRYPLRAGTLVEWVPDPIGADYSVADIRAASYLQEEHVRAEALFRAAGVQASSWLATAFDLDGRVDIEAMTAMLCTVLDRHEGLRSGFRLDQDRLDRHTYPSSHVRLQPRVVGDFDSGEQIAAYLEQRFDEFTNPLDHPMPSVFAAILRDDTTTVVVGSDHSRTDGYSLFLVPDEFHQLRAAQLEGRPHGLGEVASHVDYSHRERSTADAIDADHRGVRVWKQFLEKCGGALPEFPMDRGVGHGEIPPWSGLHEQLLDAEQSDRFAAACKDAGAQFLIGLVAATAIAIRDAGGPQEFHTTVPVHTRSTPGWERSLGWYVNSLPITARVQDGDEFADVVASTRQSLRAALPALKVPCSRAWELTGTVPLLRNMVSFMDLRPTPGSENWDDWNVSGLGKPPPGDHVFFWYLRTHAGTSITSVYPETTLATDLLPRVAAGIGDVLSAVAAGDSVRRGATARPSSAG